MHFSMQIPKKGIKIFITFFHSVIFIFITSLGAHLTYHSIKKKCLQKDNGYHDVGYRNSGKYKVCCHPLWSFPGSWGKHGTEA